jgi:tRNA (cmo5U34)-methyltransferase
MSERPPIDTLYAAPLDEVQAFTFDEKVARVFPDMIRRSVPGYGIILNMLGIFTARYAQPGSRCYDLGCSLGGATLAMRHHLPHADCRIIAVDNAPAMIERCRICLAADDAAAPVELKCADIMDIDIEDASLVVLNFTLQFIEPSQRLALMKRICQGMRPGGALVIAEKIVFDDPQKQALMDRLHQSFKQAQGYSELEISQKRTALDNILVPDTLKTHRYRLRAAGFQEPDVWYRCLNFAALIALK